MNDDILLQVKDGNYNPELIKQLQISCTEGTDIQAKIFSFLGESFFVSNLTKSNSSLVQLLNLVNNLCVNNEANALRLFPIVYQSFQTFLDEKTALPLLRIFVVATQKNFKEFISFDVIKLFLNFEEEEIDLWISFLLAPIMKDFLIFSIEQKSERFLDMIHSSFENHSEFIDPSIVEVLLSLMKQELSVPRSKIIGFFFVFITSSREAYRLACNKNAHKVILDMKKIDKEDPLLLEWICATLRVLVEN